MHRIRRIPLLAALFCLYLPAGIILGQIPALSASNSAATPDRTLTDSTVYALDSSGVPGEMLDLMRASREKYLEGSNLIRAGDSGKAREAFNKAVDIILQSNWDLTSTPVLYRFFQDLTQRILEDESCYLQAPYGTGDKIEKAVVDNLDDTDLLAVAADSDLQDNLADDLAKTKYEIPITMNDRVERSLDFWLNQGRKHFVDGLRRSGQYRPIIEKVFREESIPLDLMYLAQVESFFKPDAVSRAKAKGIWQFQKATAMRYGLKVTREVDERSDPEKSTRAAARYLNDLFAMFNDWNLVLAAYNWGEGKVQRLINSTGLKDFWQLVDLKRKLPNETKNHVPMIQASVILAKNPEKYGLPTKLDPPLQYAKVSVSKPIDLRAAAKALNTTVAELKKLNPALSGLTTPANYPNFQLKVPPNSDPDAGKKLASLPEAKIKLPTEYRRHKVLTGETLSGIAARYRVSIAELAKANSLSTDHRLKAGVWLQVPLSASNPLTGKRETVNKAVSDAPRNSKPTSSAAASSKAAQSSKTASLAVTSEEKTATRQNASR